MIELRLFLVHHRGLLRGQNLLNRQKRVHFPAEAIVFIIISAASLEDLRLHLLPLAYDFRQDYIPLLHYELLLQHLYLLLDNLWTTVCITSKEVILSDR